jgi:hypothetical protein
VQGKNWIIQSVNETDNPGVVQYDTLQFTSGTSGTSDVAITRNQSTNWATSCAFTPEGGLTGVTAQGQSFLITLDSTLQQLTCQFLDTSSRRRTLRAAGLSAFLGSLIGVAAGVAGSQPLVGALVGLAAALTGSLVTATAVGSLGSRFDSSGAWVADDGKTGNKVPLPDPYPYPRAAQG